MSQPRTQPSTQPGALSPQARDEALAGMRATDGEPELDVLVVGGGVVGAGTALDAVTRGLSTGLLEQRDLASGTSSRSSKLVHGGLRYLEMLDFGLVREALQERGLLLTRLAPHLVRPVSFLYPLTHHGWERPYVAAGLTLYDGMATLGALRNHGGGTGLPRHKHLLRRQVARIAPDFRYETIAGAIQYWDCQVDDARLVVTLARTAASHGARVATRVKVTGFLREGERVVGVRALDLESQQELEVRARVVVNAAGVWTDEIQGMVGGRGALHVQASKGIHLVVPRDRIRSEAGFIVRTATSVLFVIPWGRHWIIGTTDTPWDLDKAHPAASRADIDYVLGHVNAILREPLDHDDVVGVYAGLRPLLSGESEPTSRISREHTVVTPVPGLVMIAGGKLTTYRVMGKDAVDAAAHSLRTTTGLTVRDSITDRVPLVGAADWETRSNQRVLLARRSGLHVARIDHLLGRYGGLVDDLLDLVAADPSLALPLEGAEDYLAAEVVYAVTHEGARHLDDVLTRRTRISIETFDRGVRVAPEVARLMGEQLGWDAARTADEIDHYRRRVEAERQSQLKLTDQEADEARVSVRDIV
jgi:glycerol-3-phosphate dehydrogenase